MWLFLYVFSTFITTVDTIKSLKIPVRKWTRWMRAQGELLVCRGVEFSGFPASSFPVHAGTVSLEMDPISSEGP